MYGMEEMNAHGRARLIRTAGCIALGGNLVLALVKIILGRLSGSLAVIGDGVDSCTDVGIALMTVFISGIIERPGDAGHPWGHGRAETTATMILSFIIFIAGSELFRSSVTQLTTRNFSVQISTTAIVAAAVSIIGKTLLALSQFHFAARCRSQMLRANGQNMCNDIITSAGVLLGLGAARYFRLPALDPAVAMGVSIWIMKNALSLLWHTNQELMDGGSDRKLYKKLFTAVMQVPGVSNPHKARIRKLASRWDIDLDIEVAADMTVHAAHELTDAVEQEIRRAIPDVYDVVIHVEPAGHGGHHRTESYGLNAADIDDDKHPDTASAHKS